MTTTFWISLTVVLIICVVIFNKTVSGDKENDYRLRDILARAADEDEEEKENKDEESLPQKTEEYDPSALEVNVYEEMEKQQKVETTNNYSTTIHVSEESESIIPKNNLNFNQDVYYEKINDDACDEVSDIFEDNEQEDEEESFEDKKPSKKKEAEKNSGFIYYIKTFWRGVTFTAGIICFILATYGFLNSAQTTSDDIIFAILLLAGVILLK